MKGIFNYDSRRNLWISQKVFLVGVRRYSSSVGECIFEAVVRATMAWIVATTIQLNFIAVQVEILVVVEEKVFDMLRLALSKITLHHLLMKTGSTLFVRRWLDADVRELLKYTRILMVTVWVCTRCELAIALKSIVTRMLVSKWGVAMAVAPDILVVNHDFVLLSAEWRSAISIIHCDGELLILKMFARDHRQLKRNRAKLVRARLGSIAIAHMLLSWSTLIVTRRISRTLEWKGLTKAGIEMGETAFAAAGELDWGLIKHYII